MKVTTKFYLLAAIAAALVVFDALVLHEEAGPRDSQPVPELDQLKNQIHAYRAAIERAEWLQRQLNLPADTAEGNWGRSLSVIERNLAGLEALTRLGESAADSNLPNQGATSPATAVALTIDQVDWRALRALAQSDPNAAASAARRQLLPHLAGDILPSIKHALREREAARDRLEHEQAAHERRSFLWHFLDLACLLLTFVALALGVRRWVVTPLKKIEAGARLINAGKRSAIDYNYAKDDEIGAVARAVNDTVDKLRSTAYSRDELERQIHIRLRELREREHELRESRTQLQRALDGSQLATWEWDLATNRLDSPILATALLGYGRDEIQPTVAAWQALMHKDDLPRAIHASTEHLAGRSAHYEVEVRHRTKTGEWRWIRAIGRIVQRDTTGKPLRVAGTHADIHDRKSAEEKLSQRERQLELALAASGSALWDIDVATREVYLDDRWSQIVGGEPGPRRVKLTHLYRDVHPGDLQMVVNTHREIWVGHKNEYFVEHRIRHKFGGYRWIRSCGSCVARSADGHALRVIGTHVEITTLKTSEAALSREAAFFSALNQTALDLLSRRDRQELLQGIVARCAQILDATFAELDLIEGEELVVHATAGDVVMPIGERTRRDDAKLSWRAIETRLPQVVDDYETWSHSRTVYRTAQLHAAVVFPIVHGDRCLGTIGLARVTRDHPFTLKNLEEGQLFAQLTALVLHHSGIYEDAVRAAEERTMELRQSEHRLREAQRIAQLGHWEYPFAQNNKYEIWSEQTYRIFGLDPSRGPIDRVLFESLLHPSDLAHFRVGVDEAFAEKRRFTMDYRIVRPDGQVRNLHDEGEPVLGSDGAVIGMQGVILDVTDRITAENALRESEAKFRDLFDHSPVAITLVSLADNRLLDMNATAVRIFGYEREKVLGSAMPDVGVWMRLTDREAFMQMLQDRRAVQDFEAELCRSDGTPLHVIINARIAHIGGQQCALSILTDVTEIRRTQEALRNSETLFHGVFDKSPIPIVLSELPESTIVEGNHAAELFFGYSRGEAIGRNSIGLHAWTSNDARQQYLDQIIEHGTATNFEAEFRLSGGRIGIVLINACTIFLGSRKMMLSSFLDITARKQAEAGMRESQMRYEAVFEASPVMLLLLSFPSGEIVAANAAACAGYQKTRQEMLGHTTMELAIWADVAERMRYLQMLRDQQHVSNFETRFRRANGEIFPGLISGSLITVGATNYTLNSIQDISAQRQAEERLRQTQKLESLGTLAGGIAHDFNNLLTGILGFVELSLGDIPRGHRARPWLENIAQAGARAKGLVQQILTFSRQTESERGPVDLAPLVSEALRLARSTLPPMVNIERDLARDLPSVVANATQIHQVVMNLLTNAWHALPAEGGTIRVALQRVVITANDHAKYPDIHEGDAVKLSIIDNGCGMDETIISRIFDPFFTTKPPGQGTGLGLAVVHGIVRSHGGAIGVDSVRGKGTTFDILLPAVKREPNLPIPQGAAELGRGQSILLVDDDDMARKPVALILQRLGYRVEAIAEPVRALELVVQQPGRFDLVITDFAMPTLTGAELASRIRALRPDLPIILLSGYVDPAHNVSLENSAITLELRKPADLFDLSSAVARCLALRVDS